MIHRRARDAANSTSKHQKRRPVPTLLWIAAVALAVPGGAVYWVDHGVVVGILVFFGWLPIIGAALLKGWSDWYDS